MAIKPTVTRSDWPGFRIRVGGTDITHIRDAPVTVPDWGTLDPGGYDSATLVFAMLTWANDRSGLGSGDLSWYREGAYVTIETRGDHKRLYHGRMKPPGWGPDGMTIECDGDVIGPLSTQLNNVLLDHHVEDIGRTVAKIVSTNTTCYVDPETVTGIEVDRPGAIGDSRWGRVTDLLSMAQLRDGTQFTLLPDEDEGARYNIVERDMTTHTYTAHLGAPGVTPNLTGDFDVTAWWGEGQRPDGGRWYNYNFPYIGTGTPPDFPNPGGAPLTLGDTNADTVSGDGITVLVRSLARYGIGLNEARGVFTVGVKDAVEALQDEAGLSVTGVVNEATWTALFSPVVENQSLYGAYRLPLVIQENTRKWDRNAAGAITGINDQYDPAVPIKHEFDGFGTGCEKATAREWVRGQKARQAATPNLTGTITFDTDPEECHRYEIKAGGNIYDPPTGLVFHIASARVDTEGGSVTCDVSTRGLEYLDLASIIERNREARANPAKRWAAQLSRRSAMSQDMTTGWDYEGGAGLVPPTECVGGGWTTIPVFAGRNGAVAKVELFTTANTEFATIITARQITAGRLNGLIPEPLAHRNDRGSWVTEDGVWQVLFGRDEGEGDLGSLQERKLIVYAAGTPSGEDEDGNDIPALPCGYWPHESAGKADDESLGANLTGEWTDESGFDYYTLGPAPFLWLSVWCRTDTTLRGRLYAAMSDGGM